MGGINSASIESRQDVRQTAEVLRRLAAHGLSEPAIAAGWTRSLIAGGSTTDIDVSYVGDIPYIEARTILRVALDEVQPANRAMWDVEGIWNAQTAYGVTHTIDNFLLYYLNSIDSVYLAADGKLHDPTRHGFEDAAAHVLRMNMYDMQHGRTPTPSEHVNTCLENCRRIAKFGWRPTAKSIERISTSTVYWQQLGEDEQYYFVRKLARKYTPTERAHAQSVYAQYGWGFVFDLVPHA